MTLCETAPCMASYGIRVKRCLMRARRVVSVAVCVQPVIFSVSGRPDRQLQLSRAGSHKVDGMEGRLAGWMVGGWMD